MRIHIENFRNIQSLDFEIPDKKVSFLYGISGTGKSSLIKAMSQPVGVKDMPIGKRGLTPAVLINGSNPDYEGVRVYNEGSVTSLVLSPDENENAYSALVGDESELAKLEDQYRSSIDDLRKHLGSMLERRDKIAALIKAFGPIEGNEKFSKKSGARKIETELHGPKASAASKSLLKKDPKYIKFINDGAKLSQYGVGKCPFCDRKMSVSKVAYIEAIRSATQSTFKMVFDNTFLFCDLGISEPEWTHKRSYSKFEKTLLEQIEVMGELNSLIEFCQAVDRNIADYTIPKGFHASQSLLDVMPFLKSPLDTVNGSISEYRKLVSQMKSQFNKLVKGKTKALNARIDLLGIPYRIEATALNRNDRKVSYCIRHVSDPAHENNGELLSTGEKNVLALLIFTMNGTGEVVIFDDPVSSYDEYRRSQLYKHIINETKSTVIVCSHDQSFIKQAIIDKKKDSAQSRRIGLIGVFDNKHGAGTVQELAEDDFGSLRSFVCERIQFGGPDDYYRSMLNLRLICEIDSFKKKGLVKRAAWGYTSAILHGGNRDEILGVLASKGVSEKDIQDMFKREYELEVPPVPSQYDSNANSSYSTFERIIIGREKKGVTPTMKYVMDDIVHLNNNLAICLNPYKYTDYPRYIVDKVEVLVPVAHSYL